MFIQTLARQSTSSIYAFSSADDVIQEVNSLIHHIFFEQVNAVNKTNLSIEAIKYHLLSPGQQFRAKVCLDACMKLDVDYNDMVILAAAAELLHEASLIHDDVQDGDEIRRNQPAVWKKFGKNIAICAGDLLLSTAYSVLADFSNLKLLPKLISTIHTQTRSAIEGQSKDIGYKNNPHISIEKYIEIASQKSGGLLNLPIELALIAADKSSYIGLAKKVSAQFAVGYQMADDLDDIIKDSGNQTESQSVNIIFVLRALGCKNEQQEAVVMCQNFLNNAIDYSQQLPNGSGLILTNFAKKLINKINQ
jgi:geranylgeranyl pyrophosphate synthase